MAEPPVGIYSFEGIGADLDRIPLAARRALEHAGLSLSSKSWQSLSLSERQGLVIAGMRERVDVAAVAVLTKNARPLPVPCEPANDPDSYSPPLSLTMGTGRSVSDADWASLRSPDRYALAAVVRDAHADSALLQRAIDSVMPKTPRAQETPKASPSLPPPAVLASALAREDFSMAASMSPPAGTSEVRMVSVAGKPATSRRAVASGTVNLKRETVQRIVSGNIEKGDVRSAARIAAVMAAKRTPDIVPLCHPVALTGVECDITADPRKGTVRVQVEVAAFDRTGVEMEALTAVAAACLCIYDMVKSVDAEASITELVLLEKEGGRSGHYRRPAPQAK